MLLLPGHRGSYKRWLADLGFARLSALAPFVGYYHG
jgi:hypothetical protein